MSVAGAVVGKTPAVSQPGVPVTYVIDAERPESVPTPALVTFTVCAAGLVPPAVALKLMLVGLRPIAGVPDPVLLARLGG